MLHVRFTARYIRSHYAMWFKSDENLDLFDVSAYDHCSYDLTMPAQTMQVTFVTHLIFGLDQNFSSKPFTFFHYLSIISAFMYGPNNRVVFHYCVRTNIGTFLHLCANLETFAYGANHLVY